MSALVELREASKWYGAVIGVNEVSLELGPGITGLLGPNGAGKSTLMRLIVGIARPSLGQVLIDGRAVRDRPESRREVGYAPETDGFWEGMRPRRFVEEMGLLSGLTRRDARERAARALEEVGMATADKPLRACSKGMRQRVKIAQAIVHDPRVVVLDEPLTGIDPVGREDLLALFRRLGEEGKLLLVSTHILHEVEEITERIVLLARGRVLAAGSVPRIRDLLDDHPLAVRLRVERPRDLAVRLAAVDLVAGMEFGGEGDLVVRVRRPEAFFRSLPAVLLEAGGEVERIEPLDASAEAVFGYLVGGGGAG